MYHPPSSSSSRWVFISLSLSICFAKSSLSGKYRPVVVRDGPCTLKQQRFKNPVPHSDQRGMLAVIAKLLDGFHQCKLELFPVSFLPLIRHFLADLEPAFACRSAQRASSACIRRVVSAPVHTSVQDLVSPLRHTTCLSIAFHGTPWLHYDIATI